MWAALKPSQQTSPITGQRRLCGHARNVPGTGWVSECINEARFVGTDDDGQPIYACPTHATN